MTKNFLAVCVATSLALCSSVNAQLKQQYFSAESLSAPDKLEPVGAKFTAQKSVYYVRESAFGFESLDAGKAQIKVPSDFTGSVFVKFESDLVNQAINSALVAKGVKLATSPDEADLSIFGQGLYRVHLMPYLQRQIRFNGSFDQFKKSASIEGAESRKIGAGDALLKGSTTAASGGFGSAGFLAFLIESTMDLTGATAAMERTTGWSDRQRGEQSITFGDCYDNTTRLATCPPGMSRNNAYTFRTRFQYVEFKTGVVFKGTESQKFTLIARSIDGRTETKDGMNELLGMAIQELIAGFPTSTTEPASADANEKVQ